MVPQCSCSHRKTCRLCWGCPGPAFGLQGAVNLSRSWNHCRGGVCVQIQAAAAILLLIITELPCSCPVLAGPGGHRGGSGIARSDNSCGRTGFHPHPSGCSAPRGVLGSVPLLPAASPSSAPLLSPLCPVLGQEHARSWQGWPGHPTRFSTAGGVLHPLKGKHLEKGPQRGNFPRYRGRAVSVSCTGCVYEKQHLIK